MKIQRKVGIAPRYGGGLLVVVHLRAPRERRRGATERLLRELTVLQRTGEPAVAAQAQALLLYMRGHPSEEACAAAEVLELPRNRGHGG